MGLSEIIDLGKVLLGVVGLAAFFFFYFKHQGFRNTVNKLLVYLPGIAKLVASRIEDKKGEFDLHDTMVVLGRVSEKISATIHDPANVRFEDVQDEVFDIVRSELANYKNLPGVPDLNDPAILAQVRVVFENIQRALGEDSA